MSAAGGSASSVDLILRRVIGYIEDVNFILHHEILTTEEKCNVQRQLVEMELKLFNISELVGDSCWT
jgi:hypothetical protein